MPAGSFPEAASQAASFSRSRPRAQAGDSARGPQGGGAPLSRSGLDAEPECRSNPDRTALAEEGPARVPAPLERAQSGVSGEMNDRLLALATLEALDADNFQAH